MITERKPLPQFESEMMKQQKSTNKISLECPYIVMIEEITPFESTQTGFEYKRVVYWSDLFCFLKHRLYGFLMCSFCTCRILVLFFLIFLQDWMRHLQEVGKGTPEPFTALSYLAPFPDHHPDWFFHDSSGASLMPQTVKNLLAMHDTLIQSLCQKDSLEKGMVTHSSILPWRIPRTEEPRGPKSMVLQRVGHDWVTNTSHHDSSEYYKTWIHRSKDSVTIALAERGRSPSLLSRAHPNTSFHQVPHGDIHSLNPLNINRQMDVCY